MTAHSHLAQVLPDGRIRAIYVHYAEPEAMIGQVLVRRYADAAQLAALLDLGDLSTLDSTLEMCFAYGRDRGEAGTAARLYPDTKALLAAASTSSTIYLWRDGEWYVSVHTEDGAWYKLKPNGYVAWHGPVVPLVQELVRRAIALNRPFEQDDVIYPLWDAGYGVMLHLDDHFEFYHESEFQPRLWIVRPVLQVVAA